MFEIAATVYGLSALLNLRDRATLTVALSFVLIEYAQYVADFDWTAAHYLAGAVGLLLAVKTSRFLNVTKQRKLIASCLGLVCVYFAAWVCSELGLPESQFKWPHIAILIYQGAVLNGDSMDAGRRVLADAYQYCARLHLRYHAGN